MFNSQVAVKERKKAVSELEAIISRLGGMIDARTDESTDESTDEVDTLASAKRIMEALHMRGQKHDAVQGTSPTFAAMEAWQAVKRPANVLIDGDDVPDKAEVAHHIEVIFESYAAMVEHTVMAEMEHIEPLLWGMVNIFHRQVSTYETMIDRREFQVRELLPAAGQEVTDVQIQQLNEEIKALSAIRDTYEVSQEQASRQYDRFTGSVWRPRSGVARSASYERNITAATMDYKAAKQGERNRRDGRNELDPTALTVGIAPGSKYSGYDRIYKALSYLLNTSGGKLNIVFGAYNEGVDKIVKTFSNNNAGVTLINCPLQRSDQSNAGFKRNYRIVSLLKEQQGKLLAFGADEHVNTMFTDCIARAKKAGVPVTLFDPSK